MEMRRFLDDDVLQLTIILATLLSLTNFIMFYGTGETLIYADTISHLTIAKRVMHSPTPGLAHLGGTWLPLFHASMFPLIWNDSMYWSGLAGSIVAMACYVLTAGFIYKMVLLLTEDRGAGMVAALVYSMNPNMLYMQATPMWESMIILTMVASVYYLLKWSQKVDKLQNLVATAFAVFLATLTRYENWVLLAGVTAMLLWLFVKRGFARKKTEGYLIYFGTLAGFGVFLWLAWCQIILGDLFYFYRGEYAHIALHREGIEAGTGVLNLSLLLYSLATRENLGIATCIVGIVGLVYFLVSTRLKTEKISALVLLFPFPFFVATIWSGNSPVRITDVAGSTDMFNVRYGLMMLPAAAVFAGYLTRQKRWSKLVVVLAVLTGATMMLLADDIVTLSEPLTTRKEWVGSIRQSTAAAWLRDNYDGGLILMENKGNELITFESRVPLEKFVYEGSHPYWDEALGAPDTEWVVMSGAVGTVRGEDRVWKTLHGKPQLIRHYRLVYDKDGVRIYKEARWWRNLLP